MYREYWHLQDLPFKNVPDPKYYYYTKAHNEILANLLFTLKTNMGAAMLTGEVGCGKTTLSRALVQRINFEKYDLGIITNPLLSTDDLLREILYQFGIYCREENHTKLFQRLYDYLTDNHASSRKTGIIIDEAHLIKEKESWEMLRLLLNAHTNDNNLLHLVLIGQEELNKIMDSNHPLSQSILTQYNLKPFQKDEIENYISFRLKISGAASNPFTPDCFETIYYYSDGIPRIINNICDASLLFGYKSNLREITSKVIINTCMITGIKIHENSISP